MPYRFDVDSEFRSTLRRLHEVVNLAYHAERDTDDKSKAARAVCAETLVLQLAGELGDLYNTSFLDLDEGDSFGEFEYNAMMLDGCMKLLGFTTHEEMEAAIRQNTPGGDDDR